MSDAILSADALAQLGPEPFEALVGDPLTVADGKGQAVELTLLRVERRPEAAGPLTQRVPFSLILAGRPGRAINGGAFHLGHEAIGTLPPVQVTRILDAHHEAEGPLYHVVFT